MKRLILSSGLLFALSSLQPSMAATETVQQTNESSIDVLQRTVNTFNTSKAPTAMSNGMQITKMELTSKALVYYICVDGSKVNIKTLKAGRKALKKSLLKQYSQSNVQDLRSTIPYCREAGIGVTYYYYDAKGKNLEISFKPTEI